MFLCARFAAGIVGASVPIAMAFVCDVTTKEERPKFMAFLGSIIGAAFLLGPGIGSGLAEFSLTTPSTQQGEGTGRDSEWSPLLVCTQCSLDHASPSLASWCRTSSCKTHPSSCHRHPRLPLEVE